jgi:hypothetical protein
VGELCGALLDPAEAQMCHLDGGSGKRRQRQWIGNVLMEHHSCHQGPKGLDKDPMRWLGAVKRWCKTNGYPLPERFRKLEALRSPTPAAREETP